MNTSKFAATAVIGTLISLGFAGNALADHEYGAYRTASASGYANGHPSAYSGAPQYDYARVLSAEPIVRYVTVKTPVRECWQDVQYYTERRRVPGAGATTLLGAAIGGVIGLGGHDRHAAIAQSEHGCGYAERPKGTE